MRLQSALALLCVLLFAPPAFAVFLDGRVINIETGEPVPAADVTATCLTENPRLRGYCKDQSLKTTAEGTFRFDLRLNVKYILATTGAPGLVPTKLSKIEIDFTRRYSPMGSIVLKLTPEATITGKVLDEKGEPKADVEVLAVRQIVAAATAEVVPVSKALSNEKGVYVLHSLAPGNYYVSTPIQHEDKNDTVHPYLFFAPDCLSLDQASLTHVDAGQSYSDIDLHLHPLQFYRLQGRAQMETAGSIASDPPRLEVDARDSSGIAMPGREILLDRDGRFGSITAIHQ